MITFHVFLFMMIANTCSTVNGNVYFRATNPTNEWWSNTIIYQVYIRSFKDSDNDGIGDLKGIIQKLDHFTDLGIETLWVGPFFKSPMDDMGYDVEDFYMIDPIFGTMDDFKELVFEMNKRNLKLIIDLILNHSSYKCEWFEKSIKQEGKYKDYYMWHNASNQDEVLSNSSITPIPPNNWLSVFGGPAWTWNQQRNQFYFHQFAKEQPDFNLRNSDVKLQLLDVMEFWMFQGVSGFRFDSVNFLYENVSLLDEPFLPGKNNFTEYKGLEHIYTRNQPENIIIVLEWRAFMESFTKNKNISISSLMATEAYSNYNILIQFYGNKTNPGAQVPFNLALVKCKKDEDVVESIDTNIKYWLADLPENTVANWVMENHDNLRISSKFGALTVPMFTALKLALPGIEVTYYGFEIGMEDNMYLRPDQVTDTIFETVSKLSRTRDYERCPMQWDDSINGGFTKKKEPWLPVNPNYYKLNFESQKKIPNSNYNFYKKMSQLRKTDTLKYGDLQTSLLGRESYIVVTNFGSETETVILSNIIHDVKDVLYVYLGSENSAYNTGSIVSTVPSTGNPVILRPKSVVVLSDEYIAPETPTVNIQNAGTQIGSSLISLLSVLLLLRYFL